MFCWERSFHLALIFCALQGSLFGVKLNYVPDVPLNFQSDLRLDLEEAATAKVLNIEGKQTLSGTFKLVEPAPGTGKTKGAPFVLVWAPKDFALDVKMNGTTLSHKEDVSSSYFTEHFFRNLFPLHDKDLVEGESYEISLSPEIQELPYPTTLTYVIEKIDDDEIRARYEGEVPTIDLELETILKIAGIEQKLFFLSLDGQVKGRVSWNRKNAALHHVEEKTTYTGKLKLADFQLDLKLFVNHRLHTEQTTSIFP